MADLLNININEKEIVIPKIAEINKYIANKNEFLIMHVNIRSINGNFLHLSTLLDSLIIKPDILVCTEAWLMSCYEFINLQNYSYYTNESQLNKADGVVLYIKEGIEESTTIENYGKLKALSTKIKYGNKCSKISSFYRCKKISQIDILNDIKSLIKNNKRHKNHIILGDANIQSYQQPLYRLLLGEIKFFFPYSLGGL